MKIFVHNQGIRKILPQAESHSSEDKIFSITQGLGEKAFLHEAKKNQGNGDDIGPGIE